MRMRRAAWLAGQVPAEDETGAAGLGGDAPEDTGSGEVAASGRGCEGRFIT